MPTLLYKDFTLVKGVKFDSWRRVGSVTQSIRVYNMREVDELVFLDISATEENHPPDFNLIDELADDCFVPLTVGGGIKTVDDVTKLLRVGADKIAINTAAILNPNLIKETARLFGSQCVVVSIDAKKSNDGKYRIFTHSGRKEIKINPVEQAEKAEALGAGEIILTSIDKDGTMEGYDIELIKMVANAVSIPVIASGGAGNYQDMKKAIDNGASAVAAASIFHFTEQTPLEAKRYLANQGVATRL